TPLQHSQLDQKQLTPKNAPASIKVEPRDAQPKPIRQVRPVYPDELAKKNITGTVTVQFTVDTTGSVISARAISSPNEMLSDLAIAAVSKWEFEPGRKNGVKVSTVMQVPLIFAPTKKNQDAK